MGKRQYTPEEKQEALDAYEQWGPAEASRRTGIAAGTIKSWASRAGLQPVAAVDNMEAAREVAALTRDQKRINLQDAVLDKAGFVIGRIGSGATAKECKDYTYAAERLLNMFRLEMGEATSRTENAGVGERAETYLQGYRDAFKKDSEQRT